METIQLKDINLYDIGNTIQIAGTIWSGNGQCFITLIPGKTETFENLKIMPLDLSEWETLLKQADTLETEMFAKDETGKLVKILFRKSQRQIDSFLQWAAFKRDNYSCRYCGRTGIPLTVDHIDLYENGGATILENLVSACRSCNKDRGRMEYADWLNSDQYKKRSNNLTTEVKKQNNDLLNNLEDLKTKRVLNVRTR